MKIVFKIVIFILCINTQFSFAQILEKQLLKIDSLNIVIKEARHDTLVVGAYFQLSEYYKLSNPDTLFYFNGIIKAIVEQNLKTTSSNKMENRYFEILGRSYIYIGYANKKIGENTKAINAFEKSLELFEKVGSQKMIANALVHLGGVYYLKGDIPKTLELDKRTLEIYRKIGDNKGVAKQLSSLAIIYEEQGDIIKALQFHSKSLSMKEKNGDRLGVAITLYNLGALYKVQGEQASALEYWKKSIKISKEIDDKLGVVFCLQGISSILTDQKDFTKALNYLNESVQIAIEINDLNIKAQSLQKIAFIYKLKEDYNQALEYYNECLRLREKVGNKRGIIISLYNIAEIYNAQNKLSLAKKTANKSLRLAKELGYPQMIKSSALINSKIAINEGDYKEALMNYDLGIKMRDSVRNNETEKETIRQEGKLEIEKREKEIELLSVKNEFQELKVKRNSDLVILFSAFIVLSLILIFFVFKSNRRKQYINDLLQQQNEAKAIIIKEIHHRVKNNLQVVNSLLRRQVKDIKDKKIIDMFKLAQSRVVSMAVLHEKMYNTDNLEEISVKEHIQQLAQDLVNAYEVNTVVKLHFNITPVHFKMDTLVPLGLILNELITNSLKYAFVNKEQGNIYIDLNRLPNDYVELIIGDDGIGIREHKKSNSDGMGAKIINSFVKQIKGELTMLDKPGTFYKCLFQIK